MKKEDLIIDKKYIYKDYIYLYYRGVHCNRAVFETENKEYGIRSIEDCGFESIASGCYLGYEGFESEVREIEEEISNKCLNPNLLKQDEIYFGLHGDWSVIFMPNEYEIYDNDRFYNSNSPDALEQIRVATQEEKDWLNACIEANKFIPKEEVNKKESNKFEPGKTYSFYWDWNIGYEITDAICKSYDGVFVKFASYYNKTNDYKSTEGWFRLPEIKNIKEQVPVKDDKTIPEYVECIETKGLCYGDFGKIYKVLGETKSRTDWLLEGSPSGSVSKKRFKPSTKEAYDSQNKPKSIQKWSEGTYVVALVDNAVNIYGFNKGVIAECDGYNNISFENISWYCSQQSEDKGFVKWFATKSEAEEFAKTLLNSNNMFKRDDYIVLIKSDTDYDGFTTNFCYKQRDWFEYLMPIVTAIGDNHNGWRVISYDSSHWRYATKEEIYEYDRLGKPFDVTTLNKKEDWEIDYQNILDIEVGDTIRCISFDKSKVKGHKTYAGTGWKENLETKVKSIDDYGDYKIYFLETGNGVYSDAVRLVKRKDSEENFSGKYEYWSKGHKAELLEEIKRKYPIGSKFECLHGCTGGPINNYNEIDLKDKGFIRWYGDDGVGCLYSESRENKWAKVIYDNPIEVKSNNSKAINLWAEKTLGLDDCRNLIDYTRVNHPGNDSQFNLIYVNPATPEECFKKSDDDLVVTYNKIKENIIKIDFSKNQEEKDSFKINLVNKNNKNKLVTIKF